MGFFDGLVQAVLPVAGSYFGGPVGGMIGSAVAGGLASEQAESAQDYANARNYALSQEQMQFQREGQERAQAFSAAQADLARNYDLNMSNTAWRRAVYDIQAAGLNPMLAYSKGPASTPNSPSPSGTAGGSGSLPVYVSPVTAANEAVRMSSDVALKRAEAERTKADEERIKEELRILLPERVLNQIADIYTKNLNHRVQEAQLQQVLAQTELTREEKRRVVALTDKLFVETKLDYLKVPKAENEAEAEKSWFKKEVSPYAMDVQRFGSAASSISRFLPFNAWRRR